MNPSRKYSVSVRDVASDCGYLEVISGANPNERIIANALIDQEISTDISVVVTNPRGHIYPCTPRTSGVSQTPNKKQE
jgi:hypothetical protein